MRFNLGSLSNRIRVCADVLPWSDPFGIGITFHVVRRASKRHQDVQRQAQQDDPVLRRTIVNLFLSTLTKEAEPAPAAKEAEVITADAPGPRTAEEKEAAAKKEFQVEFLRSSKRAVAEAIEKGEIDPLAFMGRDNDLDEALTLIDHIDGLTDQDGNAIAPRDTAAHRELLTSDLQIPEGEQFAGLTLGEGLVKWILQMSEAHEYVRGNYLEAASKNSETSSAGH